MIRPAAFLVLAAALAAAAPAPAQEPPAIPVEWDAPEALKAHYQLHLKSPPPESRTDRVAFRRWVREVRRRAPEIAAAEGWFSIEVEVQEEEPLKVTVRPGARTHVAEVEIAFKGDLAGEGVFRERRRDQLRESWTLPVGKPFRQADWDDAKARLLESLTADDYAAGRIAASEARIEADAARAKLTVTLESGPAFSLGEVSIAGLARYPRGVVERLVDIDAGEPFRSERLLDLQRILQSTPYFAGVTVEIERDPAKPTRVPVRVTVVERPVADVGLSAGYGTDSGVRGEVSLRYRNAFGRGYDMQSAVQADAKRQIGYADFYLPSGTFGGIFAGTTATRDSVGALFEHTAIQGLDTRRAAVAAYRKFLRDPYEVRVGLSFQTERARPDGADATLKRALAPVGSVTWRFVDNVLDPRKGGVLQVQLAGGARAVLSDRDFLQAYAQYQHWFSPTPTDQFILRGEVGQTLADSRAGVPEEFLFRAGGTRSIRGYPYQGIGPREGDAIVGGRFLYTASAEYVRWVTPSWGAALFADTGAAADSWQSMQSVRGYGVGVRLRTPAGPLALDVAYAERDKRVRGSFSVSVAF